MFYIILLWEANMGYFSKKLRELRDKFCMTQSELADKLGVSTSTIGMYEQNRREPNFETLKKICDIFSTQADYLISKDDTNDLKKICRNFLNMIEHSQLTIENRKINLQKSKLIKQIMNNAIKNAMSEIYETIL